MLLKTRGTIKITEVGKPFVDSEGNPVNWFKVWFKDAQSGDVHELTSATNYENLVGSDVVVTLRAQKQFNAKGYKLNVYAVEDYNEEIAF